jgi:hypothetical protein
VAVACSCRQSFGVHSGFRLGGCAERQQDGQDGVRGAEEPSHKNGVHFVERNTQEDGDAVEIGDVGSERVAAKLKRAVICSNKVMKKAAERHDVPPVDVWAKGEELVLYGQVEVGKQAANTAQHERVPDVHVKTIRTNGWYIRGRDCTCWPIRREVLMQRWPGRMGWK